MHIQNMKEMKNIGHFRYVRKYHDISHPCWEKKRVLTLTIDFSFCELSFVVVR